MEVKKEQLLKAIRVLKEVVQKQQKNDNELFQTTDKLSLQFSLIKIFSSKEKIIKIELPHKVASSGTCLFVADVDKKSRKHKETSASYEQLLHKHNVDEKIEIIPLKRVKLEYSDFELKRNLSNFYDVFLCDARIIRLMPEILGKHFVGRKKFLVQVRMDKKDLKGEIGRALRSTTCALKNKGATSLVTFGDMSMSDEHLVQNLQRVLERVVVEVKGGWSNLRSLFLKGKQSLSIPLYHSKAAKDSVKIEKKVKEGENKRVKVDGVKGRVNVELAEEVSTVRNAKVLVTEAGDVVVISNKKGTLVENVGDEEEEEEDEDYENEDEEEEVEDEDDEEDDDVDYENNRKKPKRTLKESNQKASKKIKLVTKKKKPAINTVKKDSTASVKDSIKPQVRKMVVKRKKEDLKFSGVKLVRYRKRTKVDSSTDKGGSKKALKRKALRLKSLKKKKAKTEKITQ